MSFYKKRRFSFFLVFVILLGVIIQNNVYADVLLENAQADKAKLEQELANLEKEIAAKQKELEKQKG
jgi:peptidoglycan hydrolase CwlO-like protein